MKLCCAWCLVIYTPAKKVQPKADCFCCNGCRDANTLFKQIVERDFHDLQAKRKLRLSNTP